VYVRFQVPIAFEFRGNRWTSTRFQMNKKAKNYGCTFVCNALGYRFMQLAAKRMGNEGLHTFSASHFFTLAIGYTFGVRKGEVRILFVRRENEKCRQKCVNPVNKIYSSNQEKKKSVSSSGYVIKGVNQKVSSKKCRTLSKSAHRVGKTKAS
jgi:hypothetical protein